ncbi:MAG: polysaccharide deacetylase family protein [Sphingobacteriales bacterium]|jgi:peptidoglycan/xylan/chitin deacetylase (PgdA/CDA1 family)|nr:polysaccharide deacetylase family protein [Sphingobacteriales bacterium]MBP9140294.1 polysaccharide deacetylase family protein [Chitinophagales bacterium]MDA0197179.1 polysaccharide deacetylase family protein [Bacteroidota bacterium]MBK7526744.1 polysaccharide deacetylase family protein [Sphingobacteriales bacterium]MBL0248291.1 polysaccharide deacetylase family protein [Sphingobacteriales bacterium]
MQLNYGQFVISLDFELFWGVRDVTTLQQYGNNILGVRQAIPQLLAIFDEFGICATFATVGFLFFRDKSDLLSNLPAQQPTYTNEVFNPYPHLMQIGQTENADPYHYAASLIQLLQQYPQHEIASHTFSHFYTLEAGQTLAQFEADLLAAKKIAALHGIKLYSLVFPRNQYSPDYLKIAQQLGFRSFRGNESSWLYAPRAYSNETWLRRGFRLLDAYFNISGHHASQLTINQGEILNIPASRFLRPYSPNLAFFDPLRLRRITNAMTYAAKNQKTYHLWWHPHNFGQNLKQNINFLRKILHHYKVLQQKYNFQNNTMQAIAQASRKEIA